MFGQYGDDLKNYFHPAYHLKHGKGYWFDGMGYPFGEHLLFTDGHFLLVQLLNWVDNNLFTIHHYSVGIINFWTLFSIGLSAPFLYLILRKFSMPVWYSFAVALIITFLSPQIQRIIGHYSLSYTYFIPVLWYGILQYLDGERPLFYGGLLVSTILILGLIHPYYLPLGCLFLLSYALIYSIQHSEKFRKQLKTSLSLFFFGCLPLVLFFLYISITDPVTDRHPAPYGLFDYHTNFAGVFLPNRTPVFQLLSNFFTYKLPNTAEGYSYVGLVGFFGIMLILIRFGIKIGKNRKKKLSNKKRLGYLGLRSHQRMSGFLWAAVLMLILASAIPFRLFPQLLDILPPLKQFRSLGRFAWVFYYVFTVFIAHQFYLRYRILKKRRKPRLALTFLAIILLGWATEAFIQVNYFSQKLFELNIKNHLFTENNKGYTQLLEDAGVSANEFQAILGLPYYNNGSEKLYITRSDQATHETMKSAFDLGLPIMNFISPRTSIAHAFEQAQLLSSDFIEKTIVNNLNDKPLLVVVTREKLLDDEKRLLNKSTLFYENKYVKLYKAPMSIFKNNHLTINAKLEEVSDSLLKMNDFYLTEKTESIIVKRFEEMNYPVTFEGNGALNSGEKKTSLLFEGFLSKTDTPQWLEASVWIYNDPNAHSIPYLNYEEYDENGTLVSRKHYNPKFYTEVMKDWIKATLVFKPKSIQNKSQFYLRTENVLPSNIVCDNFIIRPLNVDIYMNIKDEDEFIYNNYKIKKSK